jgi:hypothetical protein
MTEIRAAASLPNHTTRSQGRLGRCQAPVIQTAAGFAPTLELPRVSPLM